MGLVYPQSRLIEEVILTTEFKPPYRPLANPRQFQRFLEGPGSANYRSEMVAQTGYDWHARKIFFEPYFRALILHHASDATTLGEAPERSSLPSGRSLRQPRAAVPGLTDLLDLPVEQVCALKRYRWTVETVIRWLKKQLGLDHLISYTQKAGTGSPQGVIMQVTVALIVYGLLVLYNQGRPLSVARLKRQIRTDLHQALYEWSYRQGYQEARGEEEGTGPPDGSRWSLRSSEKASRLQKPNHDPSS